MSESKYDEEAGMHSHQRFRDRRKELSLLEQEKMKMKVKMKTELLATGEKDRASLLENWTQW